MMVMLLLFMIFFTINFVWLFQRAVQINAVFLQRQEKYYYSTNNSDTSGNLRGLLHIVTFHHVDRVKGIPVGKTTKKQSEGVRFC